MNKLFRKTIWDNKIYLLGAMVGAVSGFFYWKFIGCLTGTCAITSNPVNSTLYFAVIGTLLFGFFKKPKSKEKLITGND